MGETKIEKILSKTFDIYNIRKVKNEKGVGKKKKTEVSGAEFLEVLEKAYEKCRYPEPDDIHKKYPIVPRKLYYCPYASDGIKNFSYEIGRTIIKKIEDTFGITVPEQNFSRHGENWKEFCRDFFQKGGTVS